MPDLGDLCAGAVETSGRGEDVEAYAEQTRRVQVRVRGGEVESLSFAETRGLGVRVMVDGRLGYAYGADPSPDEVEAIVEAARDGARFAEPDPGNVLPRIGPMEPLAGLFDPDQAAVETDRKVAAALELERLAVSRHPEVRTVDSVSYGDATSRVALASTSLDGPPIEYARTDCWSTASVLAVRDAETQSGWGFAIGRHIDRLDLAAVAQEAATRASRPPTSARPARAKRILFTVPPRS
jgi:PmbA protein